ncbi:MAG: methionyl-tRNA formyltransferase [Candidatus Peregrinibacteria bacterium]
MKILFLGTPKFAVPSLKILNEVPYIDIEAVITQPDRPNPSPVKIEAEKLNLKIHQPKNNKELNETLKKYKVDAYIVIAYGMILSKQALSLPKIAAINVHASLLPKYRGASPIQEALLNGDIETGIAIMKMVEKLDEGPVYLIKKVPIELSDNFESLSTKLAEITSLILPFTIEDIIHNELHPLPQSEKGASYCRKIKKEDGKIDWNTSAEEILNKIRAFTPWPSAFTSFHNKQLKILKATVEAKNSQNSPGTIYLENKTLKISTKIATLIPAKVQLEGKKEMDAQSFINGHQNLLK